MENNFVNFLIKYGLEVFYKLYAILKTVLTYLIGDIWIPYGAEGIY